MSAHVANLGDPDLHFWLTRSVARAVGVNLSEALAQGLITQSDYCDMVTRCRKCPHVAECQAWLAANGAGADDVPARCAHATVLNGLAARMADKVTG
jgi:hypothetical protein